jgi:hypothetical protein
MDWGNWDEITRKGRKLLPALVVLLVLALPGLVYLCRAPVLIVTDAPFIDIYGASRLKQRQRAASFALFRRVKPALVAENAGPDLIVFAVEEAASRPWGVIFPYRYADGARRYAGQFPRVRVIILDSRPGGDEFAAVAGGPWTAGEPLTVSVRRGDDFYRAGLFAALIARSRQSYTRDQSGGEILVFQEKALSPADKRAFLAGLRAQGAGIQPRFLNSPAEYAGTPGASCVVLTGGAAEYLNLNLKIPVILFSWLDPALTSRETLVIFDDSAWALGTAALRQAARGGDGGVPSKLVFPPGRIAGGRLERELRRAAGTSPP